MARADDTVSSSIAIRLMHRCLRPPTFTAYRTNSFTLEQQAHLAKIAEGLVDRHIPVLISNHDTMLTREWYQRAICMSSKFNTSISSNGGTRKKVDELLALYKAGVSFTAKNNSQGEADETVFDCPLRYYFRLILPPG
ncbi:DNA adenine methylase [Shigella flexneri]